MSSQAEVNQLLDYANEKQRELNDYQKVLPARQAELVNLRGIVEKDRENLDEDERKKSQAIGKLKNAEIALKNEEKRMETAQKDSDDWQKRYDEALDKFWKS